jgi:ABC-type multidrug transport system fused ATPase/permease subunit
VNQSPYLFSGTVQDNSKLANEQETENNIHMAAKNAELEEFVEQLADQIIVMNKGMEVSNEYNPHY